MTLGLFMTIFLADVAAGLVLRSMASSKKQENDPSSH
jgi:hypothetical protein